MRKALIAVIAASALFAVGAFAADMTLTTDTLASGQDAVVKCGDATVEWTITDGVDSTGDWKVTQATVTFDSDNCDGAEVDLAIGLNTDTDPDVDGWVQAEDCSEGANGYTCDPLPQPPVNQVIEVAVVANGDPIPASIAG